MSEMKMRAGERGNVFLFILMGVALFATLTLTVSRSMRSESTANMSVRDAQLAASDILSYAQEVERGVNRVRRRGVSENDVSFEQNFVAGYDNGGVGTNEVFSTSGGGIKWRAPPSGANDGSDYAYTGDSCVSGVGTGGDGCDSDGLASTEELMLFLHQIDVSVCEAINKELDIDTIPLDTGSDYNMGDKFTGDFYDSSVLIFSQPYKTACFESTNGYFFYAVLLER